VFPSTVDAPAESRAFLRELLQLWNADELCEVAELLTTELVVNVVRHAVTTVDVNVLWDDPTLRVEVYDGSPTLPALVDEPGEAGGYGLRLIATLAREWGVKRTEGGKVVWFRVERGDGMDHPPGS
jgi:anti-sigma regulatory factor (Ser/Thr protein kinase)